jgi:hypothetical protein
MPFEADLGRFLDTATNRHERGILHLDFQEKNEVLKQFDVLEEKKLRIAFGQEAEVEQPPKGGLAQVVGVFLRFSDGFQP